VFATASMTFTPQKFLGSSPFLQVQRVVSVVAAVPQSTSQFPADVAALLPLYFQAYLAIVAAPRLFDLGGGVPGGKDHVLLPTRVDATTSALSTPSTLVLAAVDIDVALARACATAARRSARRAAISNVEKMGGTHPQPHRSPPGRSPS